MLHMQCDFSPLAANFSGVALKRSSNRCNRQFPTTIPTKWLGPHLGDLAYANRVKRTLGWPDRFIGAFLIFGVPGYFIEGDYASTDRLTTSPVPRRRPALSACAGLQSL